MAAPKGNQNAKGKKNPNAGRKSAYEERMNAERFWEIFEGQHSMQEIEAKLKSRKYSGWDVMAAKILAGNEKLLTASLRKLVPDRVDFNDLRQAKSVEELEQNVRKLLEGTKKKITRKPVKKARVVKLKK